MKRLLHLYANERNIVKNIDFKKIRGVNPCIRTSICTIFFVGLFILKSTWKTAALKLSTLLNSGLFLCMHLSSNTFNGPRYWDETGEVDRTAFPFFFKCTKDVDLGKYQDKYINDLSTYCSWYQVVFLLFQCIPEVTVILLLYALDLGLEKGQGERTHLL